MFIVSPYAHPPGTMLSAIQRVGLTSNLQLCLDASDINSYDGTSQTWTDVSGNGYNFYRGSGSGADGADPTFNGSAGGQSSSEYFSLDGGDYFTLGQANPTWVENIHKAGAQFTLASWVYLNGITLTSQYWGYTGNEIYPPGYAGPGFLLCGSSATLRAVRLEITSAVAFVYEKATTAILNNNAWNFMGVSVNMSTGTVIFAINGATETYTGQSYASPSASAAAATLQHGAGGNGYGADTAGCRRSCLLGWSTPLSADNFSALFEVSRKRYGV